MLPSTTEADARTIELFREWKYGPRGQYEGLHAPQHEGGQGSLPLNSHPINPLLTEARLSQSRDQLARLEVQRESLMAVISSFAHLEPNGTPSQRSALRLLLRTHDNFRKELLAMREALDAEAVKPLVAERWARQAKGCCSTSAPTWPESLPTLFIGASVVCDAAEGQD